MKIIKYLIGLVFLTITTGLIIFTFGALINGKINIGTFLLSEAILILNGYIFLNLYFEED